MLGLYILLCIQAHLLVGWIDIALKGSPSSIIRVPRSGIVGNPKSMGQSPLWFQQPSLCFVLELSACLCGYIAPWTHIILITALTREV